MLAWKDDTVPNCYSTHGYSYASRVNRVLDAVIKASYMCRSCHNSYKTHQQKDDRLFEATCSSFGYVVEFGSEMMSSVDCTVTPVTRNRPLSQSFASWKRSCTSSCKEQTSASVAVRKLMYSCYIIFVFIGRN